MRRYSPLDLRADLGELGAARRHVRQTLADWYVPTHTAAAAVQVAHELLTNAMEHGEGEAVSVCLFLDPRKLTVIVGNKGTLRQPLAPRPLTTTSERGRGLHIVAQYADDWDHCVTPTRVVVWADFRIDHYKELPR
ncbi:ATP-binding protein [Streptomyces sp. NPDC058595]|uniref:ATP-binding protein n=1 Tax=Streptomyces sp. NPDC058595 TaxID=3346550 RepID=UPI003650F695